MELLIAVVGVLVTALVVLGMILATPAGVVPAERATDDGPEDRAGGPSGGSSGESRERGAGRDRAS